MEQAYNFSTLEVSQKDRKCESKQNYRKIPYPKKKDNKKIIEKGKKKRMTLKTEPC